MPHQSLAWNIIKLVIWRPQFSVGEVGNYYLNTSQVHYHISKQLCSHYQWINDKLLDMIGGEEFFAKSVDKNDKSTTCKLLAPRMLNMSSVPHFSCQWMHMRSRMPVIWLVNWIWTKDYWNLAIHNIIGEHHSYCRLWQFLNKSSWFLIVNWFIHAKPITEGLLFFYKNGATWLLKLPNNMRICGFHSNLIPLQHYKIE
jgi:hypothetical protein